MENNSILYSAFKGLAGKCMAVFALVTMICGLWTLSSCSDDNSDNDWKAGKRRISEIASYGEQHILQVDSATGGVIIDTTIIIEEMPIKKFEWKDDVLTKITVYRSGKFAYYTQMIYKDERCVAMHQLSSDSIITDVTMNYDEDGRFIGMVDDLDIFTYEYNNLGLISKITRYRPNQVFTPGRPDNKETYKLEYDSEGRNVIRMIQTDYADDEPLGEKTFEYDYYKGTKNPLYGLLKDPGNIFEYFSKDVIRKEISYKTDGSIQEVIEYEYTWDGEYPTSRNFRQHLEYRGYGYIESYEVIGGYRYRYLE